MRVPFSGLVRQAEGLMPELLSRVETLARTQSFILGEPVRRFELRLERMTGATHAVGVASGTDALILSLRALGIGPGDAVVVPAFGFVATAEAVVLVGARPVFADVEGFVMSPDTLRRSLAGLPRGEDGRARASGARVRAAIVVHLFGECAPMVGLCEVAEELGLVLVEDAAQAILAGCEGRGVGGLGRLGAFSFFPSKNLGGWGDGGAVTTVDAELARRVRRLRAHGFEDGASIEVGTNSRLDALQATILDAKAAHLEAWTDARRRVAVTYADALASLEGRLRLPSRPAAGSTHVHNQFVLRVPEPEALARHLAERGVETRRYYPRPIPAEPAFAALRVGTWPGAEEAARTALGLPIYPELTAGEQAHVIEGIVSFFERGGSTR